MLMNGQTATVKQMTEAVYTTEVVVAKMRREISGKRLRDKRAAFEALFNAVDSSDVELVTAALVRRRRVDLDEESFVLRWIVGNEQSDWKIMVGGISSQFPLEAEAAEQEKALRLDVFRQPPARSLRSAIRSVVVSWQRGQIRLRPPRLPCCALRSRLEQADQAIPRTTHEVVPPTSRFSAVLVVTSCRSSRTAPTSSTALAIRAASTVNALTAAEPDEKRYTRGCPSCSSQSSWDVRNSRQRATTGVGASKTTRQLWVEAACLPITATIPLDTNECDEEGTGVDLVMTEHDPAGKLTCPCYGGLELVIYGGPKGGDTYSRDSDGTVSMDHSDKHSSVEIFSGDIIFVNGDEGSSMNRRPQSTKFEVKCPNAGFLEGAHHHQIMCLLRRLTYLAVSRGLHVREDRRGGV